MTNFKYQDVHKYLYSYISDNKATGNQKIPSERNLSKLLGVSRTTVKYAIDKLIDEKVLYKVHGKGTFINPDTKSSRIKIAKESPDAFNLNVRSKGLKPKSTVVSFKVLYDHNELSHIFPSEIDEFYELIRIRSIEDVPFSIEKCYFPFRMFSDANRYDFSSYSLYEYMNQKGELPILFNKSIEAIYNDYYNSLLQIKKGSPLFLEQYVSKSANDNIVEYTKSYTDPQHVVYKSEL